MKWFSLIYQGDIHPSTDEKVISHEDFGKLVTATEVMEKAKEDAELHLETTKKQCLELKKEAEERGFEEGLGRMAELLIFHDRELKELRLKMQQMVLPIALKAAKRIVGKELESFPETIVDIVMQAIAPITESHQVTLFVNKADRELLEKEKPRLKEALDQVDILRIEEKSDIERGGCIIKTEGGMINASLENQWRAIERALDKYRFQVDEKPSDLKE